MNRNRTRRKKEKRRRENNNKCIPLLLFLVALLVPSMVVVYFASSSFLLVIITIFLGFIIGIFYKEIIFNIIPKETFMDIGYLKIFQPMYRKFVARSLNLLSDSDIKQVNDGIDEILKLQLVKDLINNRGKFDDESIKKIKGIIIKNITTIQILGIDIKKGFGEPVTEVLARCILKDKKKEELIKSIDRIESLLYAISCTNQSKPSIREVKQELKKLRDHL